MGLVATLLLNSFRPPVSVTEVMTKLDSLNLGIDFVVEAGAHHGTDTLQFLKNKDISKIFCFEPNPNSALIFQENLSQISPSRFSFHSVGLFDEEKTATLFFPKMDLGGFEHKEAGTSSLMRSWAKSDGTGNEIKLVVLDTFISNHQDESHSMSERSCGLLWLDVEGSSLNALRGMELTLRKIIAAKIECEYRAQPGQWESSNVFKIIKIMQKNGFMPLSGYLHPISRGDLFFVRKSNLGILNKLRSVRLLFLISFFYGFVYPVKSKLNF